MSAVVSHGACGKSWVQRGERTSHCGACHATFANLTAFDAHFLRDEIGRPHCGDPAAMVTKDGAARFVLDTDGYWIRRTDLESRNRLGALGCGSRDSSPTGALSGTSGTPAPVADPEDANPHARAVA